MDHQAWLFLQSSHTQYMKLDRSTLIHLGHRADQFTPFGDTQIPRKQYPQGLLIPQGGSQLMEFPEIATVGDH